MNNKQQLDATIKAVAPRISVHTFSEDGDNCRASIIIKLDKEGGEEGFTVIYGLGEMPVKSIHDWEFIRTMLCDTFTEEEQERYLVPIKVENPLKSAKGKAAKKAKAAKPDTREVVPDEEELPDAEDNDTDMDDHTNSM